jgi:hypothetical protein
VIAGWRVLGIQASVDETRERFGGKLNVRGHRSGSGSERDRVGFQVDGEAALRAGGGDGDGCRVSGGFTGVAGDQLAVVDDELGDLPRDGGGGIGGDFNVPGVEGVLVEAQPMNWPNPKVIGPMPKVKASRSPGVTASMRASRAVSAARASSRCPAGAFAFQVFHTPGA